MGFGIFGLIHSYIPLMLYLGALIVSVLSAFYQARIGIWYTISLMPFTYALIRAQEFPLGNQLLDILLLSIIIGSFREMKGAGKPKSSFPVLLLIAMYVLALINGLMYSTGSYIINRHDQMALWKDFIVMPILYFLTFTAVRDKKQSKIMVYLIFVILLIVEWRFYDSYGWIRNKENFDEGVRGGQFGYLGSNEFAAFLLNYTALCIGIFLISVKGKLKLSLLAPIGFGIFDIMYSFSRGAYVGLVAVLIFLGFIKKKILIGLIIFVLCFSIFGLQVLPKSVMQRIEMTTTSEGKLEDSAGGRLMLWTHVMKDVFPINPIFGVGYGIFQYIPDDRGKRYLSPHSNYMEILAEQGIIGLCILLFLYYAAFKSGWSLYKISDDNWAKGLGIGFCSCVLGSFFANFFGNRWTYYQVMSYFWIVWGVVDRYYLIMYQEKINPHQENKLAA